MAQSYYLENDFADAAKTLREIAASDARAGQKPEENTLLTLASAEFKAKNEDGYIDALTTLAGAYPKHEYWVNLTRAVEQKPGFAPRLGLDLDRVAVAAGAFDTQRAICRCRRDGDRGGLPGRRQIVPRQRPRGRHPRQAGRGRARSEATRHGAAPVGRGRQDARRASAGSGGGEDRRSRSKNSARPI